MLETRRTTEREAGLSNDLQESRKNKFSKAMENPRRTDIEFKIRLTNPRVRDAPRIEGKESHLLVK